MNEHYNPNNFEADIALVQIEKPVLLTDFVRPVCFPYPSNEENVSGYQLSEGNQGVVVVSVPYHISQARSKIKMKNFLK